jgi:hypothetical protein
VETVDLYSPETQHQIPVFARSLDTGWHVVRVEVLGQSAGPSSGTRVRSDGFEYVSILGEGTVDAPRPAAARRDLLGPNHPNPFRPRTTIHYTLERAVTVRLVIYDVHGAELRVLEEGRRPAGEHEVEWDGRDAAGRRAAAGVYFYEIRAGGVRDARKMVRLN